VTTPLDKLAEQVPEVKALITANRTHTTGASPREVTDALTACAELVAQMVPKSWDGLLTILNDIYLDAVGRERLEQAETELAALKAEREKLRWMFAQAWALTPGSKQYRDELLAEFERHWAAREEES
jgi:hypothetical protein